MGSCSHCLCISSPKIFFAYTLLLSSFSFAHSNYSKELLLIRTAPLSVCKPNPGGLSNLRLGTIDRKMKCEICMANMAECSGHFDHLELAKPIYHIGFMKTVLAIMRCVCYNCSKILADEEDARFKQALKIRNPKNRLKRIYDACKSKKKCAGGDDIDLQGQQDSEEPIKKSRGGCGAQQPNITIDGMKMVAEYKAPKKKS
ncbi:hypothetical protein M5K25_023757 [Dendrobium thyrsiflorum]|uniref:DNA-directed RNA polymerase n=1 Tax=Dendrobium thyrsiflorum TaxID=117978 RepID=A0ABD0U0L6_DENTH